MSHNIRGFKSAIKYPYFFDFINKFDIIILVETHIDDNTNDWVQKYLPKFKVQSILANRTARFGRASGGLLIGYKQNLNGVNCSFLTMYEGNNYSLNSAIIKIKPFLSYLSI